MSKRFLLSFLTVFFIIVSCRNKVESNEEQHVTTSKQVKKGERIEEIYPIFAERIDGPANIRDKPNGEVLFTLNDNVLVEVGELNNNWYPILIQFDINASEYLADSIFSGYFIIANRDTIGKVVKSQISNTGAIGKEFFASLYGYTHKNNIKPETIIERRLEKQLVELKRELKGWKSFIETFDLMPSALNYENLTSYYTYESAAVDPSPGFRIAILFEDNELFGIIHSREISLENTTTHQVNGWHYKVTFFNDYPQQEQLKFTAFFKNWLSGVD